MYLMQTLNHSTLEIDGPEWNQSEIGLSDDGQSVTCRLRTKGLAGDVYLSLPLPEARWFAENLTAVLAALPAPAEVTA